MSGDRPSPATIPSADELMARARADTGIDLIDAEAVELLGVLVRSTNEDGQMHAEGAAAMEGRMLRILSNRLRMIRDIAAHPEILDERIEAPIVVCGMGRTGSTKLQKLLAATGDFNWLPHWQALYPSLLTGDRAESPAARIEAADTYTRWLNEASPEMKSGHAFETHEPEEESALLEHSLVSPVFMGWTPLDQYLGWLMGHDLGVQFRHLGKTLRYLQWQGLATGRKRWVLKAPLYAGLEGLLLAEFPDARLVMTHRHPVETTPSSLRLMTTFYKPFSNAGIDVRSFVAGLAAASAAHMQVRRSLPEGTFLDLAFGDVVRDPLGALTRIYRFADAEPGADALRRAEAWDRGNPPHKRGAFTYNLDDYGLSRQAIEDAFRDYVRFLEANLPSVSAGLREQL
jgi:hypothetical protein